MPPQSKQSLAVILTAALLSICCLCGCQRKPDSANAVPAVWGPREKFAQVMERFKRRCVSPDDVLAAGSQSAGGEQTWFRLVINPPSYKLHEPADGSNRFTAEVTVSGTMHYSRRAPLIDLKSEEAEPKNVDDAESSEQPPVDPFEPKKPVSGLEPRIDAASRSDEFTDTYDLAYEGDRWVLKSRSVEDWIQMAFDYALKDQQP